MLLSNWFNGSTATGMKALERIFSQPQNVETELRADLRPRLLGQKEMSALFLAAHLVCFIPREAAAQLAVAVQPVKVIGQKAIVPLAMKNEFSESIESARAVVFLMDEQGKMVSTATKWVVGGKSVARSPGGLAPQSTNLFSVVLSSDKPFRTTNLTTKVVVNRLVLSGGKEVPVIQNVIVK